MTTADWALVISIISALISLSAFEFRKIKPQQSKQSWPRLQNKSASKRYGQLHRQ
jgi:hypothetical protein